MTAASCGSCHEDHPDFDPCLQHHLEQAERTQRLLVKLKAQSDLIIKRQLTVLRTQDCFTETSSEKSHNDNKSDALTVSIDELTDAFCLRSPTVLLVFPCDFAGERGAVKDAFNDAVADVQGGRWLTVADSFCVCGKCTHRVNTPLTRMAMVLRTDPVIVSSAGRGMTGFVCIKNTTDFDGMTRQIKTFIADKLAY